MIRRVLLLDDEPAHRMMISRVVRRTFPELEIIELSSLAETRNYLQTALPLTICLVDYKLGDGKGSELIREITQSPNPICSLVIGLSTSNLDTDRKECMAAGAAAFFSKSADYSDLIAFIKERFFVEGE